MTILVTGGAGFIGANFILDWFSLSSEPVVNIDALTYAGNRSSLASLNERNDHMFVEGDICDRALLAQLFSRYRPRAVIHFAAESHVDRSLEDPAEFIKTNVEGTFALLDASLNFWRGLSEDDAATFRFLHISTDEVFGSLGANGTAFTEDSSLAPNSPYSASKAASDHLVRAWHHSFGLPTLTTHCSNNYGPLQYPEKLVPLIIARALAGEDLPIYGDGLNIRDWLYVGDHCAALRCVLEGGSPGSCYNIGGNAERTNVELVAAICGILNALKPKAMGDYSEQICFVADRPGHDRRYAVDSAKLTSSLGWRPSRSLEDGLTTTIEWYLSNQAWINSIAATAPARRGTPLSGRTKRS